MSFWDVTLKLLDGFKTTTILFLITLVLGLLLGILFTILSLSKIKVIYGMMRVFVWIIRGTPLMLQIIVVFYVPGLLFNMPATDRFIAVIIALTINYAVYFSEIYRGGYLAIQKGQKEASLVLGLRKSTTFFKIYVPQIIKKILPPISNETISLVKDTALARVVAVTEVIWAAQKIVSTYAIIWVLFYTGVFYLVINGIVSLLFRYAEKKLNYYEG